MPLIGECACAVLAAASRQIATPTLTDSFEPQEVVIRVS